MDEKIDWPRREPLERVGPLRLEAGRFVHGSLDAGVCPVALVAAAGTAPGPVLYVQAVQHGNELNGADVSRRILQEVSPAELSGTLVLIPMANPLAARTHRQSFPALDAPGLRGRHDQNRRWFSTRRSDNFPDRLVEALKPVVALADACLDLHCHEYLYPPIAWTNTEHAPSAALGLATGMALLRSGNVAEEGPFNCYCRSVLGVAAVIIEMPPLHFVDHHNSAAGFRGVVNAMKSMGMLPGRPDLPPETAIYGLPGERHETVTAAAEGFLARYATPGEKVAAGRCVGEIFSPADFTVAQRIEAPMDGYLLRLGRGPDSWGGSVDDFVHVGDPVADFRTPSRVVRHG